MNENFFLKQAISSICDMYSPLSKACQEDLLQNAIIKDLNALTILTREGQHEDKIYFILEGAARAYYLKDGKDVSDWFAFDNEFICSINSFFLDIPSPHFVELIEPSKLLCISKKSFASLADAHHDFERLARVVLTRTLLFLQQRVVSVQFESARQKYENLLKMRPDIVKRVALGHIASYLGITLETLSRIRNPKSGI